MSKSPNRVLVIVIGLIVVAVAIVTVLSSTKSAVVIDRAYVVDTARVVLVDSTTQGASAEVRVRVEIPSGGPLGDVMTEDHTFRLVNSGGTWLLTGIPWPLFDCGVSIK